MKCKLNIAMSSLPGCSNIDSLTGLQRSAMFIEITGATLTVVVDFFTFMQYLTAGTRSRQ